MEVTVRIEGFNKQIADQLIARTPLIPVEQISRYGWDYTLLYERDKRVGIMRPCKTAHPLHIELHFNALDPGSRRSILET